MSSPAPPNPFPFLDYSLAARDRDAFISQLRTNLLESGCMYLVKAPVPEDLIAKMISAMIQYFELPDDVKAACDINNSAHFNGYQRRGPVDNPSCEHATYGDDNAVEHSKAGTPVHYGMHGATLWPPEDVFPGGRAVMLEYYHAFKKFSLQFTEYVAEALGMAPDGFEPLFEREIERRQGRVRFLRYPPAPDSATGLKSHKDTNFLSYILQSTPVSGLEVGMVDGTWARITSVPGTIVLLIGDNLEKVTKGMVRSTPHRVISSDKGTRYSAAFFQGVAPDTRVADIKLEFPQHIKDMSQAARKKQGVDINKEYPMEPIDYIPAARSILDIKLRANPVVAWKFYSKIFPELFPNGVPQRWAQVLPEEAIASVGIAAA